jgi:hypothetical protein
VTPLLGIYPKQQKSEYNRDPFTTMFIVVLFIVEKLWKQARCPTTDEWFKKMRYMYTMKSYSAMQNNDNMSFESK